MCGIAGLCSAPRPLSSQSSQILQAMTDALLHRGPDQEGFYRKDSVALGVRRLRIIDLKTGDQPISNEDETVWVVLNGEIYNYQELRELLEGLGHRFKTQSDTETIVHLYEEYGEGCVRYLRGMFAFALWDERKKQLLLARDRLGKKPLFYFEMGGELAFASEMQGLLPHPRLPRQINLAAIDLYLSLQYIPSPQSILEGVQKLPPAHTLLFQDGVCRLQRYWELPVGKTLALNFSETKALLLEKLKEAVRLRMISEVPLGAFLSGGIDSSCVVALMSELSPRPVKTFSIGFTERDFSELAYARHAARHFGCDHHELIVRAEMSDVLSKLARHYGEPYADSSALPSYYVARETRKSVTVALNGDGGDETFAGYLRYRAMLLLNQLPLSSLPGFSFFQALSRRLPERRAPLGLLWRLKRFSQIASEPPQARYLSTLRYFSDREKDEIYSPWMKEKIRGPDLSPGALSRAEGYLNALFQECSGEEKLRQMLYVDLKSYLPECLMAKMDIASMANSLETRSPFLDHRFVEFAYQIPDPWKLNRPWSSKWILRQAFKDRLPKKIYSRGKQGFSIPVGQWLRTSLKERLVETVLSPQALARPYFDPSALRQMVRLHLEGKREFGYQLWALLMLELWHQEILEKRS
ncbi:MAG: asparagine synthase (glutamine-hydrolyzing) [Elusimicrobia bacterium]|nr:asparagine synthase (glutamine-hydrolyzing) [Elusimicrobiota bacterium]